MPLTNAWNRSIYRLWAHCAWLPCGPYRVPTVALELRLITELYRQRRDRYRPLLEFMRAGVYDQALIARGLQAADVPPELQAEDWRHLGGAPLPRD